MAPGGPSLAWAALGWLLCGPTPSPSPRPSPKTPFKSFAVYALSRGKGVPAEAREAIGKVRDRVEADRGRGQAVRIDQKRIGIEGETRVCAEYEQPGDAARAFEAVDALLKGVELVNLVVEPCSEPEAPEKAGKKEERKP